MSERHSPLAISDFQLAIEDERSRAYSRVTRPRIQSQIGHRQSPIRSAFTLTEMVVVIAIIILLLAVTLPGLSSLWNQRNEAEVETTLRGVLASVRQSALLGNQERGLFFCVLDGEQKIFQIEHYGPDPDYSYDVDPPEPVTNPAAEDRFRIVPDSFVYTLPAPLRVAPRNIVNNETTYVGNKYDAWNDLELLNENYRDTTIQEGQHHRNWFTAIFSPDGRLKPNCDVVIQDEDDPDDDDQYGDGTGLIVRTSLSYYDHTGATKNSGLPFLSHIVVDDSATRGLCFPGVDGLLIYDEREFKEFAAFGADAARQFLLDTGKPIYVSRASGATIVGPSGENQP